VSDDQSDKMAEKARENVLSLEVKKDGLGQLQDGCWVLKLKCHPADMPLALMQAPMGARYMAALVEINDQDHPKEQTKKMKMPAAGSRPMSLVKEAGRLCADARFAEFLQEQKRDDLIYLNDGKPPPGDIAACVRLLTGVESRKEFDEKPEAAARWRALKGEFDAWIRL
jgi:hypothetical protein